MKYIASFIGRKAGAIGRFYPITAETHGDNEDEARLNLYDRYEHIQQLKLTRSFEMPADAPKDVPCPIGDIQPRLRSHHEN